MTILAKGRKRGLNNAMHILCVLGIASLAAIPCLAQTTPAAAGVAGTVIDQSGAIFPGAVVAITDANGKTQNTTANERGEYSFADLPPGSYTVSVSAEGFKKFESKVEVAVGAPAHLDISMQAADASTKVEVAGQRAAGVETDTAQVSGTITEKEVVSVGLNGRNFTQLIALAPGVSNQTGQDEAKVGVVGSTKYSVNGGRVEYNTFDVDGSDLLNVGINGSNSTLIVYPSLDAIQEVKVLTSNYGAMYGRTASGTVLVVTKRGAADFMVMAITSAATRSLNARNFFDETQGAPLYRRSDLGGTVGGPLYIPNHYNAKKDKTFFFFSEEYRLKSHRTNTTRPCLQPRNAAAISAMYARPRVTPNFSGRNIPDCPALRPTR